MIVRAAIGFGLAWLLLPHQPDLGLGAPQARPGDAVRQTVFARLGEVKREIEMQHSGTLVTSSGWEAALQKAGRLPDDRVRASFRAAELQP